jgi:hypothetical protein
MRNPPHFSIKWRWHLVLLMMISAGLISLTGYAQSGEYDKYPQAPEFIVCAGTYALCTGAPCTPLADAPGFDACSCEVMTGYSAGQALCQAVQNTGEGQSIISRYYPITSYAPCSNDRPWAQCLDSPCLINQGDPTTATCFCTEMKDQGTYLFYDPSGQYTPTSCDTGLYSLATVEGADQITEYLQTHNTPLKPLPIKIYDEK